MRAACWAGDSDAGRAPERGCAWDAATGADAPPLVLDAELADAVAGSETATIAAPAAISAPAAAFVRGDLRTPVLLLRRPRVAAGTVRAGEDGGLPGRAGCCEH